MAAPAVHVVEDHDAALPLIYRAIGSRKLPFSGLGLIHFDSHPDLLSPSLLADECADKEKLFAFTSIAEWILPAVYMGHISCIVWVKPPWALQITEGTHLLHVGKDITTGQIRVGTPLPYYITELLYVPVSELENVHTVPLHVMTVYPLTVPESDGDTSAENDVRETDTSTISKDHEGKDGSDVGNKSTGKRSTFEGGTLLQQNCGNGSASEPPPLSKKLKLDAQEGLPDGAPAPTGTSTGCSHTGGPGGSPGSGPSCQGPPVQANQARLRGSHDVSSVVECLEVTARQLCTAIGGSSSWILDIDLDFFSTGNPFKSIFTEVQFECLRDVYRLEEAESPECPKSISRCVERRKLQLGTLRKLWSGEDTGELQDGITTEKYVLPVSRSAVLKDIQCLIGTEPEGVVLDAEDIHLAGMMTDLPEHLSSEEEISGLIVALHRLLCSLSHRPSMITIARSSEDSYTPRSEVDNIQDLVLAVLKQRYGCVREHYHYLESYTVYDSRHQETGPIGGH